MNPLVSKLIETYNSLAIGHKLIILIDEDDNNAWYAVEVGSHVEPHIVRGEGDALAFVTVRLRNIL